MFDRAVSADDGRFDPCFRDLIRRHFHQSCGATITVTFTLSGFAPDDVLNELIDARICVIGAVDVNVANDAAAVGFLVAAPIVNHVPADDGSIFPWILSDGFVLPPDVPVVARYISNPNTVYARPSATPLPAPVVFTAFNKNWPTPIDVCGRRPFVFRASLATRAPNHRRVVLPLTDITRKTPHTLNVTLRFERADKLMLLVPFHFEVVEHDIDFFVHTVESCL